MSNPLAAISGIGTIALGYIIYRDIGIKKVIVEKQVEVVTTFLDKFKQTRFEILILDNGVISRASYVNPSKERIKSLEFTEGDRRLKVFVSIKEHFNQTSDLKKQLIGLYMPKQLTGCLSVVAGFGGIVASELPEKYALITIDGVGQSKEDRLGVPVGISGEINLGQFVDDIKETLTKMSKWIENHTDGLGLNI